MPMMNPPHPGEIVRCECLEPLRLTVTRPPRGLASLVKRSRSRSMRERVSPLKWLSVCHRASDRPRKLGLAYKLPTILLRQDPSKLKSSRLSLNGSIEMRLGIGA